MTNSEYKSRLYDLKFTCGMNERYHHRLEARCGWADRVLRIAVGVLAVVGVVLAVPGADSPPWGFLVAIASAATAIALNVVPIGDWEKRHGELFRLWSDLHKDTVVEELKTCEADDVKETAKQAFERLCELTGKANALNAVEPAPVRSLLIQAEEEENESIWGKGIRTNEQVEAERGRRSEQSRPITSGAACASGLPVEARE